jgi:Domain of unknown function (DUF4395)/Thioredoxin
VPLVPGLRCLDACAGHGLTAPVMVPVVLRWFAFVEKHPGASGGGSLPGPGSQVGGCYTKSTVITVQKTFPRLADPWADTDVIDSRAPRFNQTVVALLCGIALLTGWWGLASLMGLQLAVGLILGRRWCVTCVFYFEVIQPRFGEGQIEDARPPRFANLVGAVFLGVATAFQLAGVHVLGWSLIALVGALATFAAVTGICVGCNLYKLSARVRGIRPGTASHIDLEELGVAPSGAVVVEFTHPLCTECREVEKKLKEAGYEVAAVDVSRRQDLARKYNVSVVPTAFLVDVSGQVEARLA